MTEAILVLAEAPQVADHFFMWQTCGWFVEISIKQIYSEPLMVRETLYINFDRCF